jgi:hypothetical protein
MSRASSNNYGSDLRGPDRDRPRLTTRISAALETRPRPGASPRASGRTGPTRTLTR